LATVSAMIWITSWPSTPSIPVEGCELSVPVKGKHLPKLHTPAENSRSPQPVRGLQPMHRVGCAEFAGLHDKGD
jgi:hypothetical protein